MSDEKDQRTNLRVLEFNNKKEKQNDEANKLVADMFKTLSERALAGDIEDFIITFKSNSRGVESMIGAGGGVSRFDFLGYIGMLEILKTRLMSIMSQMTYAYPYERAPEQKPKQNEPEPLNEQPTEPEKPEV